MIVVPEQTPPPVKRMPITAPFSDDTQVRLVRVVGFQGLVSEAGATFAVLAMDSPATADDIEAALKIPPPPPPPPVLPIDYAALYAAALTDTQRIDVIAHKLGLVKT
jgi:hypothetical protein